MVKKTNRNKSTGKDKKVLIPVDFSQKSWIALCVGFELAKRLNLPISLLHASIIPNPAVVPQFPDDFNGMDNENAEIEEMELEEEVNGIDERAMRSLKKKIETLQQAHKLPDIPFDTILSPGMPEEVIAEYCAVNSPSVVVMATRGKDKRKEEQIGSITAEVLDHCVAPLFTVPEDYSFNGFKEIVNICAFCYFEGYDENTVNDLMSMFDNPQIKIFLFPATEKIKELALHSELSRLAESLKVKYPNAEFIPCSIQPSQDIRIEAEKIFEQHSIQMILAPNRKRNLLSRIFKPSLPHKILYEIDFPMLAIPV